MKQTIFIDESGTPVLSDGNYYVICAVCCPNEYLEYTLEKLNEIRNSHRVGSELKSSGMGSKHFERRESICKDLAKLKLKFYAFALHKCEVDPDSGLSYKTSGYKYCQRRLFEKLYRGSANISVVLDTFGSDDFMASFEPYIHRHFKPDLFNQKPQIKHATPQQEQLLQVSDFIAGTIRRSLEKDDPDTAYDALSDIRLTREVWPRSKQHRIVDEGSSELDTKIEEHCTCESLRFLDQCDDKLLSESVIFLLNSHAQNEDNFICGDRLLEHLCKQGFIDSQKKLSWLQQKIISPLRKGGVPIAGSPKGYKIPRSRSDLNDFITFVSHKTLPYLRKVNEMRIALSQSLGHTYDMLDEDDELKKLMKSLDT
jgi:hypothetical protein